MPKKEPNSTLRQMWKTERRGKNITVVKTFNYEYV